MFTVAAMATAVVVSGTAAGATDNTGCDILVLPSVATDTRSATRLQSLHPNAVVTHTLHDTSSLIESIVESRKPAGVSDDDINSAQTQVCLASGTHHLYGKPWSLSASTPSNVMWKPAMDDCSSATPPVVSGGLPLNKWYPCNEAGRCPGTEWNGVWVHYKKDISGHNMSVPVRNLWVGGERISRSSRSGTDLGPLTSTATGYTFSKYFGEEFTQDPGMLEFLWPRAIRNWIEPRCTADVNTKEHTITVEPQCWTNLKSRNNNKFAGAPTLVENVGGPPAPGTFFTDDLYVFYRPSANITTAPTDAWIGEQEILLEAANLYSHTWTNITFEYSSWDIVNNDGGYVPSQSAVPAGYGEPLGMVRLSKSVNVVFEGCTFQHAGNAWALSVTGASQTVTISRNIFNDLSGGAAKLGNVNDTRAVSNATDDFDMGYSFHDNLLSNMALEYRGAAAVFAGYVRDSTISHNTIENTSYTGISLGWGWGRVISFARNNHVIANKLINVMQVLNDGGCVYTLGPQPNSTVQNNYCRGDSAPVVGCFYHDNGSRYFNTTGNVADTSPAPCVYLQGCCNAPALDCHVSSLYCRSTAPVRNGCEAEDCTIDNATLFYVPATAAWPAEAQAVIDAAGVTA